MERTAQMATILIAIVIGAAALDALESIFAPMTMALVAGVVLSPLSAFWERVGIPNAIGALVTLSLAIAVLGVAALIFQPLLVQLVEQAPKVWADMQATIGMLRGLMRSLAQVSKDVTDAMAADSGGAAAASDAMRLDLPTFTDALMLAPAFLGRFAVFSGTLFFFILTRAEIYAWAALRLTGPTGRAQTTRRLLAAEQRVSRYFLAITLVNSVLGVSMAVIMQIIGLPGAVLWGLMAFLLNFVVYLGPAALCVALLFAGVAAFDGAKSLMPLVGFILLNGIEGQFVTPAVVGRQLSLNPLLVFLALVFGIWLWGPLGGVVAIPLLVWILVLNDGLREPEVRATPVSNP